VTASMAGEDAPFLSVRSVSQRYATRRGWLSALEDVRLDVRRGEFVSVIGPSGCGKSTLLKIIAGLLPPTRGSVLVEGRPVTGPWRDLGVVFQQPVLFPWRSVLSNAMLVAEVQGLDRARAEARARMLLDLVGMRDFADGYPHELSGGMQQRVGIVRALLHDPALLLMDEPFGALDALTRERMNVELQRIWQQEQRSIVFVTHSIPESVWLGDRVVVLSPRPGRVVAAMDVDLPRPRTLEMVNSEAFGAYVRRLRAALEEG
jgi:NitT/TauT family transport system ATP-binding protein